MDIGCKGNLIKKVSVKSGVRAELDGFQGLGWDVKARSRWRLSSSVWVHMEDVEECILWRRVEGRGMRNRTKRSRTIDKYVERRIIISKGDGQEEKEEKEGEGCRVCHVDLHGTIG